MAKKRATKRERPDSQSETGSRRAATPEQPRGLWCSVCGCRHFEVIRTRETRDGRIRRRRACRFCGKRITTFEAKSE